MERGWELLPFCISLFSFSVSRPVAIANLIVARTTSILGVHFSGPDGALHEMLPHLSYQSVLASRLVKYPIWCIGKESA